MGNTGRQTVLLSRRVVRASAQYDDKKSSKESRRISCVVVNVGVDGRDAICRDPI